MIQAKSLTKIYSCKLKKETLKEELSSLFWKKPRKELLYALQDVSFNVEAGELVALIGQNGAGKSTLLKLLSQVILPTKGEIHLQGKVGALLEVGAGFHPELSGRENIFLSGAILGMRQHLIKKKFEEIVAFAEIEPFLEMPVKKYSSGMFLRLAFSVIAHLDNKILIIDEVLSVGDDAFQKKSLTKIREILREGTRTLFFVSHQLELLQNLCSRTLWLSEGKLILDAPTPEVIAAYINNLNNGFIS